MTPTVTPVINRNNRKNKSGLYVVQIRVTINRQTKYFSLDEKVALKYWTDKPNKWIKESHPHNSAINKLISDKVNLIEAHIFKLKIFKHAVTLKGITEFVNKRGDKNSFNDYFDNYLRDPKVKFKSLNTIKKYRTCQKHLNNYNPNIPLQYISEALIQDFSKYLTGLGIGGATVLKYFDPLKKICRHALKNGYLERDPFYEVDLGIEISKPKRTYLEIEEIQALKNVHIPKDRTDLENVRKHFLFCFYAGFYYADLRKLTWKDVHSTDEGYVINGKRFKNDQGYFSPIYTFKHAVEILENQKGCESARIFPEVISDQKYNDKLKILAKLVGMDKKLTNKVARHSYVQYWQGQGLAPHIIAKMVGHNDERTTNHYFDTDGRDVILGISKINNQGSEL